MTESRRLIVVGVVAGEEPVLPEGLHYEFHAKRQLLVPSEVSVKSILDGGEMVYAKVSRAVLLEPCHLS